MGVAPTPESRALTPAASLEQWENVRSPGTTVAVPSCESSMEGTAVTWRRGLAPRRPGRPHFNASIQQEPTAAPARR